MLDWLVVGGGVHGTHLSLSLLQRNKVRPERLRVLDPHPAPLHAWRKRCAATGMTHLRSPGVHHLDMGPASLRRFAGRRRRPRGAFRQPYDVPSLDLFRRHCDHLVHTHGLEGLRLQGSARGLELREDSVRVEVDSGGLEARRVVLALGPARPRWPEWARDAAAAGAPVQHAFGTAATEPPAGELVVLGGGLSAAQVALRLAEGRPGRVTLLTRHDWRVALFDADPTWIGTGLRRFQQISCLERRRAQIRSARRAGSITPHDYHRFRRAERRGDVRRQLGEVASWGHVESELRLRLVGGEELRCAGVVLATGFCDEQPGSEWLRQPAEEAGLPCAPCGTPRVDKLLRWHPRLHLAGSLAELELGPAARNIVGARLAAERLSRLA